jgi:Flp pilus assembly protein TadG
VRLAPIYGGVSLIAGNYTSARILIARLLQEVARLFQEVARLFQEESGSAVLEFIMVALPLFLPLAIFLQSVEAKSQGLGDLNNAARQVARAFTTSPSEELAPVRANEVLMTYQNEFHLSRGGHSTLTLSINCQMQPCLTPNAKVTVTLTESDLGLSASASQIVDAWRSTG